MDRKIFRDANFEEENLHCPHCEWHGRGDESVVIDFYGITRNQEVRCPECDAIIGQLRRQTDRDAGM
jgi:uncharacterized C2H2 Zn-finger protein